MFISYANQRGNNDGINEEYFSSLTSNKTYELLHFLPKLTHLPR